MDFKRLLAGVHLRFVQFIRYCVGVGGKRRTRVREVRDSLTNSVWPVA